MLLIGPRSAAGIGLHTGQNRLQKLACKTVDTTHHRMGHLCLKPDDIIIDNTAHLWLCSFRRQSMTYTNIYVHVSYINPAIRCFFINIFDKSYYIYLLI